MFCMLLAALEGRTALVAYLKERGIWGGCRYLPRDLSAMGRQFGGEPGDRGLTEDVSDRLLRLPFYYELSEAEQADIVAALQGFEVCH